MIELYTASTPNGHKVSCCLEALELEYVVKPINLSNGDQFKDDFLKISPNGRIPAIIDRDCSNLHIFESGAILIYLSEKTGRLMSSDPKEKAKTLEWLMFQMSGVGPMMGQANVFFRYFPEKIESVINRYQNECRRLFEVMDKHLDTNQWFAQEYSIADIANWCWVRTHNWSGVSIEGLENLDRWKNEMYEQPGMLKGIKVPQKVESILNDKEKMDAFTKAASKIVKK